MKYFAIEKEFRVDNTAGGLSTVCRTVSALQARERNNSWKKLTVLIDTRWAGTEALVVAGFYVAAHKEWPGAPTRNQLSGFVSFIEERYDAIVMIPTNVTTAVIGSVFTGDYRVFEYIPKDTLMTLQLLITAAITAHRGIGDKKLHVFYENIARELTRYRR